MNPTDYYGSMICPHCQKEYQFDVEKSKDEISYYKCPTTNFWMKIYLKLFGFRKEFSLGVVSWWSDYHYTSIYFKDKFSLHLERILPLDITEERLKILMVFN
jgi:hypothetical protein